MSDNNVEQRALDPAGRAILRLTAMAKHYECELILREWEQVSSQFRQAEFGRWLTLRAHQLAQDVREL